MENIIDIFFNLYRRIDMLNMFSKEETEKDKKHLSELYNSLVYNYDSNSYYGVKSKKVEGEVLDEVYKLRVKYSYLDIY